MKAVERKGRMEDYLSPKEVANALGIGTRALRLWVSAGKFPRGIKFTRQVVRWPASVVEAELKKRQAASEALVA